MSGLSYEQAAGIRQKLMVRTVSGVRQENDKCCGLACKSQLTKTLCAYEIIYNANIILICIYRVFEAIWTQEWAYCDIFLV